MKHLIDIIQEKLIISKTINKIKPKTTRELANIIKDMIDSGDECLDLQHIDVSELSSLKEIIVDRPEVKEIDVTGWDVSNVQILDSFIDSCVNLKTVRGFETWNTKNVQSINCLFMHCTKLTDIDLDGWKLNNVGYCQFAFSECPNLKIDLTNTGLNVEGCQINVAFALKSPFIKYE
jgi:hypothetical protein